MLALEVKPGTMAWGAAAAWVLTGGDKLPPDWDHLRTGSTNKFSVRQDLCVIFHQLKQVALDRILLGMEGAHIVDQAACDWRRQFYRLAVHEADGQRTAVLEPSASLLLSLRP